MGIGEERRGRRRSGRPKPKNWVSSGEKAQTTRVAIVATAPKLQAGSTQLDYGTKAHTRS